MNSNLNTYINAILPEPYRILGVTLRPFSIGHMYLLKKYDCALGDDDVNRMGDISDLILAIVICSRSFKDFNEFINNEKEFAIWMKKWSKVIRGIIKIDKSFNIFSSTVKFKQYMKEGIVIPRYWENNNNDGDEARSGVHWSQNLLFVLQKELGYSQEDALDLPLSKAFQDYYKFAEANGMLTLMSDDEIAMIESNIKEDINAK